jgi:CheY-like chemotaxis protein
MYNILFVDDDRMMRELTRCALEPHGYFVHAVPTAEVALMILKENIHFDVLITDVIIPGGMNGFELAEAALKLQPELRVIYLTGFVNLPRRQITQLRGKLVHKPVQPSELEHEVRSLLALAA